MKRRGRNNPSKQEESGHMHFRLCHLCYFLNEGNSEVTECSQCRHAFKDESLTQFFDNNDQEAFSDQLETPEPPPVEEREDASGRMESRRQGHVYGLSVVF